MLGIQSYVLRVKLLSSLESLNVSFSLPSFLGTIEHTDQTAASKTPISVGNRIINIVSVNAPKHQIARNVETITSMKVTP